MKTVKYFLIYYALCTFFLSNSIYADVGYNNSKISIALVKSDYIFIGKVYAVEKNESVYKSSLEVVEVLKGN